MWLMNKINFQEAKVEDVRMQSGRASQLKRMVCYLQKTIP